MLLWKKSIWPFFFKKPGRFQCCALVWGNLEPSYTYVNIFLPVNSNCTENDRTTGAAHLIRLFLVKTRLLTLLISPKKSELSALLQSFHHFPYNENMTRALNTISLKCCLPSTDAIDRWGKKIHVYTQRFKVA